VPDARYSRGFAVGGWAGISSTSTASADSVTNHLTLMSHLAYERSLHTYTYVLEPYTYVLDALLPL